MSIPILFGPYGSTALAYADRFREFGANAAWFHGFEPQAFETCVRQDVAACVEFKTFRADFTERPELVPIGVDGKPIRYGKLVQGVCLSKQAFLEETEANLLTGIKNYHPAGIWLDYLTYGGWFETPEPDLQESCFCKDCIVDFCQVTGIDADTPSQILDTAQTAWTLHKCQRVARLAQHYAWLIRSYLPDCIVGAYMCPWVPDEFGGALRRIFAQDYHLLAEAIDVFTPLIYVKKSGRSADWGRRFLEAAPGFVPHAHPVQLILDALDFPDSLLEITKADPQSWGVQLFGGASVFADPKQVQVFRQVVDLMRARMEKQDSKPG